MLNFTNFLPNYLVAKRYDLPNSETLKAAILGSVAGGANPAIGIILADRTAKNAAEDAGVIARSGPNDNSNEIVVTGTRRDSKVVAAEEKKAAQKPTRSAKAASSDKQKSGK